jgi:signal transduction histidine kinase
MMLAIRDLVRRKTASAVTVPLDADVRTAIHLLALHNIGGLPVVTDDSSLIGFVSERDVVHGVEAEDAALLCQAVDRIMRRPPTCAGDATIHEVMSRMTLERQRHLVVLEDGEIAGVISVGDLLKHRLEELELETGALHHELARANGQLRRTIDELAERTSEAERARAGADAASRAKSDFLTSMSHEIRTPINAIVGYIELLELGIAGPIAEEQRAFLDRISISSRHLLSLIADVLDLARIEAGRTELTRAHFPAVRAIVTAIELIAPQAHAGRIHITQSPMADRETMIEGDEDRVRQILVNLLSNAIKFTEPDGRITFTCGLTDKIPATSTDHAAPMVFIQVADTGVGIAPADLERIFEPFEQAASESSGSSTGTGVGLGISRELARLMGGDLVVKSELGHGSTFTLWLPPHANPSAAELLDAPSGSATLAGPSPACPPGGDRS